MCSVAKSCWREIRCARTADGACISVSRSIGTTPAATIAPFDVANLGRTNPGQSQRRSSGVIYSVWKCFVFPGVGATAVFLDPNSALMVDDLPTLGYPIRPTVGVWVLPGRLRGSDGPAASRADLDSRSNTCTIVFSL